MATTDDPVRSFNARMASFTSFRVAMVNVLVFLGLRKKKLIVFFLCVE